MIGKVLVNKNIIPVVHQSPVHGVCWVAQHLSENAQEQALTTDTVATTLAHYPDLVERLSFNGVFVLSVNQGVGGRAIIEFVHQVLYSGQQVLESADIKHHDLEMFLGWIDFGNDQGHGFARVALPYAVGLLLEHNLSSPAVLDVIAGGCFGEEEANQAMDRLVADDILGSVCLNPCLRNSTAKLVSLKAHFYDPTSRVEDLTKALLDCVDLENPAETTLAIDLMMRFDYTTRLGIVRRLYDTKFRLGCALDSTINLGL